MGKCAGRCAGKCTGKCAGSYPWMTDSSDLLNKYGDQHTWFSNESDESVMPWKNWLKTGGQCLGKSLQTPNGAK